MVHAQNGQESPAGWEKTPIYAAQGPYWRSLTKIHLSPPSTHLSIHSACYIPEVNRGGVILILKKTVI